MQFVDEENIAIGLFADFFEQIFEPLLEFAAIFCAGQQRRQIERQDLFACDGFGRLAVGDALRDAFDNGGFADPRLADENRIVFGAPLQNAHRPPHFLVAADDGIELPAAGAIG